MSDYTRYVKNLLRDVKHPSKDTYTFSHKTMSEFVTTMADQQMYIYELEERVNELEDGE